MPAAPPTARPMPSARIRQPIGSAARRSVTWARALWLVVGRALRAAVALAIPASPAFLPKLMYAGGEYDGHPTRHWVKALDDPDPESRRHAIVALGAIGPDATDAVP